MTCRYCGAPADPKVYAARHGRACRPCVRAHVYRRMNESPAGKARTRRQWASASPRRVIIGKRVVCIAKTIAQAHALRAYIKQRTRTYQATRTSKDGYVSES